MATGVPTELAKWCPLPHTPNFQLNMTMERLPCTECGYQNEPERVYCHNCGAKLDRSLLTVAAERRKPKKLKSGGKALSSNLKSPRKPILKPLISCLALGALLAAGLLAFLPPDNAPSYDGDPLLQLPEIGGALSALAGLNRRVEATFTERQVNAYIKVTVRSKDSGMLADYVHYLGSAVEIGDGTARVVMSQSLLGYPLHAHMTFRPAGAPGSLKPVTVGCGIGRLDLPVAVAPLINLIFKKLWKATKNDLEAMRQLGEIKLTKQKVVFASKG